MLPSTLFSQFQQLFLIRANKLALFKTSVRLFNESQLWCVEVHPESRGVQIIVSQRQGGGGVLEKWQKSYVYATTCMIAMP